jgi:RNA polymerase sigma-70 factor (ECF subfamily)
LLSRLKDWNDQEGWKVFFDTYWRLIYHTAVKAGLTDAEAQDAVQETVISVMKSMPTFEYDSQNGSFKSWLLRLTSWRITDQLRKRQRGIEAPKREPRTSTRTATVERVADPAGLRLEAFGRRSGGRTSWKPPSIGSKGQSMQNSSKYSIFMSSKSGPFREWSGS